MRPVGEQHVLEVEGGWATPDAGEEAAQTVAPPLLEEGQDLRAGLLGAGAVARRADRRGLLGAHDAVPAAPEEVVDRPRMAGEARLRVVPGQLAVEDGRYGLGGGVVDRGGVAVPGVRVARVGAALAAGVVVG